MALIARYGDARDTSCVGETSIPLARTLAWRPRDCATLTECTDRPTVALRAERLRSVSRAKATTTNGAAANGASRRRGRSASKTDNGPGVDALHALEKSELLSLYRQMYLIRRFEERSAEQYAYGKIGGFLHLYIGEEAVAVGAIKALSPADHLVTHYRDHGYALAIGADPGPVMAELFGKETGTTKGRGGSMHLTHVERHFWGGYAIVAGHLPIATGIGLALQYQEQDAVCMCIFGDGATNAGAFHEALNMAAIWKLPVIFLCENNLYAMGTAHQYISAVPSMATKALAYDMKAETVDGQDVLAMYEAARRAVEWCKAGNGPYFLEAMTYRFRGHSMADPETYRDKDEVEQYRSRDPITAYQEQLIEAGVADKAVFEQIDREVEEQLEAAIFFADASPFPDPSTIYDYVYAEPIWETIARNGASEDSEGPRG
ncbi:MAG: pyruvate dehydrogenase (acetyl-transferring) E1 component subunit alpha [Chloroflexi bacterium]|nr:MAG: pyruvate dehydrogenase (acetyl-transferring) E1 component subunit alpha [Chloroflexota bacterium]